MVQYELVIDAGAGKVFRVPVSATPLTIGRSAEAQVRVEHPAVSRIHASVRSEQDAVVVEYLGTRNGLKINGKRVMNGTLKHGDQFEVGETIFVVSDLERGSGLRPKLNLSMIEHHASNRLGVRPDPKVRALFERACALAEGNGDAARAVNGVLTIVLDLVNAQRCFFLWFGQEAAGVKVVGALAEDGNNKGPKLNGALVNSVVRLGAPMLKVDERPLPAEAIAGDRPSAMCVPLRANSQVLGALYADSGWSDGRFTTHSLQDLRALVQVVRPVLLKIGAAACANGSH